jgi:hypothetical protein
MSIDPFSVSIVVEFQWVSIDAVQLKMSLVLNSCRMSTNVSTLQGIDSDRCRLFQPVLSVSQNVKVFVDLVQVSVVGSQLVPVVVIGL